MVAPRLLLLQARTEDDPMREHERLCFVQSTGLPDDRVVAWDLLAGPPSLTEVLAYEALTVGGSGDFYVSKADLPHHARVLDLLRAVIDEGHPTFASCFGYQLMIVALGGTIIYDPDHTEVGTFELTLTEAGQNDPLFQTLPPNFSAQLGHKDRTLTPPEGIPNLASSTSCPYQALRIPDRPIWATQFHPELDRTTNLDRFEHYLSGYAQRMSEEEIAKSKAAFRESQSASTLLRCFLTLVFEYPS